MTHDGELSEYWITVKSHWLIEGAIGLEWLALIDPDCVCENFECVDSSPKSG